ncbi:uncharacterized protein CC84DRAFT_561306 [Paraphaeosphaeria sporulosa]|uniref:Zn(2)-C6 fungal-type domain-containing protein n=1 Tax=Paraphaeosphaeria sporulosa TaxID=1460663 RepID=A0A177CN61_9PLEO|nr:uncharacterized protein CC84DRAFT_561306 [Paraphaeosphaeria sporulosa]OAG08187.1 hypothetical protein CC84DRAFT_561306 [Paraphaeosphaeria sporulosa]
MATSKRLVRGIRTACDRCYQLKERCERVSTTGSCERCQRLNQVCLTVRPVRPPGRQAKNRGLCSQKISTLANHRMQSADSVGSCIPNVSNLDLDEQELLLSLLGDPQTLDYPVVSPRFQHAEQKSFTNLWSTAWPVLKDAYLAYAGVLKSLQPGDGLGTDNASKIRYATSAMAVLRSLSINKAEDAELCLTLGFALALSVYGTIGVGVAKICHYCLSVTRSFIEDTTVGLKMEPRISVLVLLETMECIVYRRTPTLRIQPRAPGIVDRHLGLCLSLLPYYYDLCSISHSLVRNIGKTHTELLHQELDKIQADVENWQPSHPEGFLHEFSASEVVQLLAQARVYRLAALLMIHRLRHPFGREDGQADIWSREVMMELELARRISDHPVRFVALPFIIAAVEIRGTTEREKVLMNVSDYVDQLTPVVQKATKSFLGRVWNERDVLVNFSWLDSIHKPCVILDSIGSTLPQDLFNI